MNNSSIINGSDFIAVFLTTDKMDPEEQIKKGISAIDLGECTQIIKGHYNISENESLIILNMESKNIENNYEEKNDDNLGKNVQIEIYDKSGRKLNLSVCDKDITVMKFIGDIGELDIQSAMDLASQGIDVFNPNDDYFNDICQEYDNSDGKDIIIKDRRTDKYQNATFCQEGCTYDGINYTLKTANCKCDSNLIQNDLENDDIDSNNINKEEKLNFNTLTESFLTSLLDFNLNPIYCYNLVLNLQIFKNNIGFYFMFIIFILQIIFFIVYIIKNVKSLRYFMLIFKNKDKKNIKSTPPQKNKINIKLNKSNNITRNEETKDYNSKTILDNKNISNEKENLNYIFDLNKKNISKKGNKNLILTNNFISNFNIQNINGNNKIIELIKSKNKKHLSRKKNHKNKFDENKSNRIETRYRK